MNAGTSSAADGIRLLDHGYLRLVEAWGSDERIIEAARMSTGKGFLGWGPKCVDCLSGAEAGKLLDPQPADARCKLCGCGGLMYSGDEKLLRFLWEHKHASPFEMGGMVIEVQAPIFVFREWHRHRTQSYNEMSARYTPLPDVNYVPSLDRLMTATRPVSKQAAAVDGKPWLTADVAELYQGALRSAYVQSDAHYREALEAGIPKELARLIVPVGRYSRMRASANLRNWLGFLTLRMAPEAQWEIRQYANAVGTLLAQAFPRTWELFAQ